MIAGRNRPRMPKASDEALLALDMRIVEMRVRIYKLRRRLSACKANPRSPEAEDLATLEERLKGLLLQRRLLKRSLRAVKRPLPR